jgi:SAM-dependent methyltransferase
MRLPHNLQSRLRCPRTQRKLTLQRSHLSVENGSEETTYPIINGIPILIDAKNSLFTVEDFRAGRSTTFVAPSRFGRWLEKVTPSISANVKAKENYAKLLKLLPKPSVVLVVGGSVMGSGMESIYESDSIEIVASDVTFGPHTDLIADAHDIPFEDETFDCVVVQAVLEHVLDPVRCVEEIHRVLKPDGLVYAETSFMQQVHMRRHDFTRFTHLGHRRLFRWFEEIESGPCCGPGMALAWSQTYFLRSLATSRLITSGLVLLGHYTSFFLKYIDYLLLKNPGTYDAAAAFFFLGKKTEQALPDRELVGGFRGL